MKINMNSTDRGIRLLVGAFLVMLVIMGPKTQLGLLGFALIATALFGYCPVYRLLGASTYRARA